MSRSHIQLPPDGAGKAALAFDITEAGTPAPNAGVRYVQAFVPVDSAGAEITPATQATVAALLTELGQKVEASDLASLATGAKQDAAKATLDTLATNATLSALSAKLPAALVGGRLDVNVGAGALPLPAGAATETTLSSIDDLLSTIGGVPVDLQNTSLPLPTGAATAANQATLIGKDFATQTTLAAVNTKLGGTLTVGGSVSVSNFPATQPISATSLPLPTGAATQATLSSIDTLLNTVGGVPVDIQDASIAVTGPLPVTDNGGSLTVDGTVAVSNFPATQPISAASLPLPAGAAQEHITAASWHSTRLTDGAAYIGTTGQRLHVSDGGVALSTDPSDRAGRLLGHVQVDNFPGSQAVTGPLTDTQLRASAVPVSQSGTWTVTQSGTVTVDSELPAAAALADATANPTVPGVGAFNELFNGATWDRQRSANASAGTTGTGLLGAGLLGFDGTNYQRLTTYGAAAGSSGTTAGLLAVGALIWGGAGNGLGFNFAVSAVGDATTGPNTVTVGNYIYNGSTWNRQREVSVDALGTTGIGMVGDYIYNGATWDRTRNNTDGTALASAARTATTSSADLTNYNGDGVLVILRVSTVPGTAPSLVLTIEGKDPASGVYFALNANPTAVTAVGTTVYELGEGASGAAGGGITQRTAGQLPRIFRVTVTHGNANSVTYSVGYSVITA